MNNFDELLSRIQIMQATGEDIKAEENKLVQQAARMEEAHKEVAGALTRVCLIEEVQEIKGGPIQQYRARVTKLSKIFQESNLRVEVTRQKEGPGQQSKSGRDAG